MSNFFSISGEFITNHARDCWAEGAYVRAMDVLDCLIGASHEQKLEILFGTKKLIGVNDLDIVVDNWKPADGVDYPDYKEGMRRGDGWVELKRLKEDKAWQIAYDEWPHSRTGFAAYTYEAASWKKVCELVGEERATVIFNEVQNDMTDRQSGAFKPSRATDFEHDETHANTKADPLAAMYAQAQQNLLMAAIESGADISAIPTVDAMMNRGTKIEVVKDDRMASASGWLLPNGEYYGCGPMEHIGLAESLLDHIGSKMTSTGNAELIAESYGWVKISRSLCGFYVGCKKKPTQKQLNRLWDYSVLHKKDYEEMIQMLNTARHTYSV